MAKGSNIELLDDMHLSSQSLFLDYYYDMLSNNISAANNILINNPSLANQIMNSQNVNRLIKGINERELEPKEDIDYYLDDLLSQFQEMINNTRIMGQFDNTLQYYPHNFVYYQGKGYYAFSQPPIGTLPTNTQYWVPYNIRGLQGYGGINLNLRFNWNASLDYKVGDIVVYKNKLWYALADNTNFTPNLNHYPWVIISMPQMPNRTPIQKAMPQSGYSIGDFWFQITQGDEVLITTWNVRQPEATPRFSSGAFTIDDKIYVTGGILPTFSLSKKNEAYDVLTGTWSQKADMTSDRARFGAFTIGSMGYVIGGLTDNGVITNLVESYNPKTNTWTTKASLPIKMLTDAVSDGTYGYVFGGVDENENIVGNGYIYNPTTNTWTTTTNKPTPTRGHAAINVDNYIYLIGGINSQEETINNVEVYDITSKTFSSKTPMTTPRSYLGLFEKAGRIYAVGGLNKDWYSLDLNERYNIEENKWETDIPMTHARSSLNVVTSGSKAYAIGGINIGISAVNGYNEQYGISDIPSSFDMTIDTTVGKLAEFEITTKPNTTNNFYIDWGDGYESSLITTSNKAVAHTYAEAGQYIVKIVGQTTGFNITKGLADLISVDKCSCAFSNIDNMFENCTNLQSLVDGIFDNSVTISSANNTFAGCTNLQVIPVGLFDQNINISTFVNTFKNTGITSIPNGLFNKNNLATTFEGCFTNCSNLINIPVGLFSNNISVINFSNCFNGCTRIDSIPSGMFSNNSYCTNFNSVFKGCTSLTTIASNIFNNAVATTDFSSAFENCTKLTTLPQGLFYAAVNANNYTDVIKGTAVTVLPDRLFNGNNATFTLPTTITDFGSYSLNGLNVSAGYFSGNNKIKTFGGYIFSDNVTNWRNMFSNATNLVSLGSQDMRTVTDLTGAFLNCTNLTTLGGFNYLHAGEKTPTLKIDLDLSSSTKLTHDSLVNVCNSLVTLTPTTTKSLTLGATNLAKLTDAEKFIVVNKFWNLVGWTKPTITKNLAEQIVQDLHGFEGSSTFSSWETSLYYEVELMNSSSVIVNRYYVDKSTGLVYLLGEEPIKEYKIDATVGGSEKSLWLSKTATNDPNGQILKNWINTNKPTEISIAHTDNLIDLTNTFSNCTSLTEIYIDDTSNVTSFKQAFSSCESLREIEVDTSGATTLEEMFIGCVALETINSYNNELDTVNVTNMKGMYSGCISMVNYPRFTNTSKVTNTSEMFSENEGMITAPSMNMISVTDANKMFEYCTSLQNVSITNVNNVINGSYMFVACSSLKTLPTLAFSSCTNAKGMFQSCGFTTMPSSVLLSKATDMSYIFQGCSSLTTVIGGFFPSTCQNASYAFQGCTSLVNMPTDIRTVFGSNSVLKDVSYLFDGCTALKKVGEHFIFKYVYNAEYGVYLLELDSALLDKQLFRNCPNITNMTALFKECTNLGNQNMTTGSGETVKIGMPIGFFYWCTKVTNISHVFDGCKNILNQSLKSLNSYLFAKNTELSNISYAFANSSFGALIDADSNEGGKVFGNCTKIEDASYLFANAEATYNEEFSNPCFIYDSPILKNIEGMYSNFKSYIFLGYTGSYNTGMNWDRMDEYMPSLQNCSKLFYNCTKLGGDVDTANVLSVINSFNRIDTLTNHAQAFYNCTKLPNYSSIPTGWK